MSAPEKPVPGYPRYIVPGKVRVRPVIKGQDLSRWKDAYHAVLVVPWSVFLLGCASVFALINGVFALLYMADPNGIANADGFWGYFLFSVQTLGSANYTVMVPRSVYANIIVSTEAFFGIINLALVTGMVFARFSRPFARVIFSNVAVVTPFDGVPTLMFRAANQRGNQIFDASVTVSLARQVVTREGHQMRRFEELKLVRARSPLFALSWTIMHQIDETSPLRGVDRDMLADVQGEIIVMLRGTDETLADIIFARHSYTADEILMGRRFVDVLTIAENGRRIVNLHRFHDTEPLTI
jgi:inward rectifier potassium channel